MGKWWSLLFAVVMLACLGLFFLAPMMGLWLPEGLSTHADSIDFLFYVILYITGFFFVLTEALLCWFMFKYSGDRDKTPEAPRPPGFWSKVTQPVKNVLHDQHRVEMAWTLVPALILLYIAFAQVPTWARVKYLSKSPEPEMMPLQVDVSARQFEWRIRYPSAERFEQWAKNRKQKEGGQPTPEMEEAFKDYKTFAKQPHKDDVHVVNELHTWSGDPLLVHLSTRDVIHSFNLPHFRVKQDALPGKLLPTWFTPIKGKYNTRWSEKAAAYIDGVNPETGKHDPHYVWDLACAELCGWGHYRMIGRLFVHKDEAEFVDWLKRTEAKMRPPVAKTE